MRRNYLANLFGVLLLLISIIINGQSSQNYQLPQIIPASPQAQNFMRYGEIPVDFSTGVPNIDIPLYTIKGKKLTLPLSISYHASGIKVNDVASEVGLGWVFNGKGLISRTTNGRRDEAKSTVRKYANSAALLQDLEDHYLDYECTSQNLKGIYDFETFMTTLFVDEQDAMSDRYFYKVPGGESGIFVYDYSVFAENENSVVTLPYRPLKIKRNFGYPYTNAPSQDGSFEITDENGSVYTFSPYTITDNSSEWYVTKIISADGTEKITFNYTKVSNISGIGQTSCIYRGRVQNYWTMSCTPDLGGDMYYQGSPGTEFSTPILTSIETDQEIITFSYDNRNDFAGMKRLKTISISSKMDPNVINRKIQFYEKYFGTANEDRRLGLDYLTIYSPGNTEIEKYSFKYNESTMLPPYPQKMNQMKFNEDFWGYSNGNNKTTNIPADYIRFSNSDQNIYGANRDADQLNGLASACMLKEIKYPTGGKTVFEFSRFFSDNLYPYREYDWQKKGYLGGFRVNKISNFKSENDPNPEIKSYVYANPRYNAPQSKYFRTDQGFFDRKDFPPPTEAGQTQREPCYVQYNDDMVYSNPMLLMDVAPGLPIMYTEVTEYLGTAANNAGKTVYYYGEPYSPSDYEHNDHPYQWDAPFFYHPYHYDKGNFTPLITQKAVFDSTDKILYKENNHYNSYFNNTFTTGIKFTHSILYRTLDPFRALTGGFNSNGPYGCCSCNAGSNICQLGANCIPIAMNYKNSVAAIDTKAIQEAILLESSVRTTYDRLNPNKFVTDSIHYVYNQHNLKIKETTTINSRGENLLTQYKYPYDFSSSQPYSSMLTKHILSPVIEQTISNTTLNKQLQKTQTSYKDWGNNIIEPEIVKGQMDAASPLENRIRYLSYDSKANPLTVKKEVGNPLTYLWGYNKSLPIAAVENTKYVSEIVNNDMNVSYSGLQVPMGNTPYELGTFTITEEKNYKIDRIYERYPENYSVMYQTSFVNMNNNSGTVSFTDTTPASGNFFTYTSPSVHLKPGTYKVKLTNIGYNGYQGQIENNFNFTIYNAVEASIPFHTSFEEESVNINTAYAKTGKVSHTGEYVVNLPPSTLGYDKVIVSYWGKASASSLWQYVENTVTLGSSQNYSIGSNYAYIDEVRVYPVDARMKTFTYDPFYKTQTSIMNENGQTEYYDYDAFGRLKEVYIMEGNVKKTIKTTNYHYKP